MGNPFEILEQKLDTIAMLLKQLPDSDYQPEFVLVGPAAEYLSITPNALHQMVRKNQITHFKKAGKLYFKKTDLVEWLESGKVDPVSINADDLLIIKKGAKSYA